MGKGLWVEPRDRMFDEVQPRAAKIAFSKKWKLPVEEYEAQGKKKDMFFARIGGFPEEGVKWVAENLKGIKLNVSLPEHLGGASFHGKGQNRVYVARKRGRRQLGFARVADKFDPETRKELEEVKEDVVEVAENARVPVPSTSLPYIGFIHSLTIKNGIDAMLSIPLDTIPEQYHSTLPSQIILIALNQQIPLLCGVLAGAVASTVVVPFDVVRTRLVAGQGGQTVAQVVSTVAHEEGLQTLFKGSLKFNIVLNAFQKGLQFTTFEYVKRSQEVQQGGQQKVLPLPRQIPLSSAGGAAAGLVGTLLSYPMQPVFDRLLLQPEKYKGLRDTVMQVLRNEGGIKELYRGITPALISVVPNAALSFYTYETLKTKYLTKNSLKPEFDGLRTLIIGGLAGAISTTLTYPLELARKEIVLSALSSSAVRFSEAQRNAHYNNTWQALNGIAKAQGIRGLFRGLTAQTLQIVPATAVTFLVYELAKRAFVASGEERRDEVKDADDIKE